jgi:tetratricopeptide (TPR) repeat protein
MIVAVMRSRAATRRAHDAPDRAVIAAAIVACAFVCACARSPARPALAPVALPDLSRADESVQAQVRELHASLTRELGNRDTPAVDLADAYGKLGMVLQAAEYYDAAEPCYLDARALAPAEIRWPYYLGHLYTDRGETENAERSFEHVLELQPNDVATLVWLGRLYLDEGRPRDAQPLFAKALTLSPRLVAALAGLGRAALAEQDYATAARTLEEALAVDPEADSLHSPLVTAYRGLGQPEKAAPHLRQWQNREIFVPDPLRQDLDLILQSGLSYELRGVRALESRDWAAAADFFRKGIALTKPSSPLLRSLHHKLGTALYLSGDVEGARQQFEQVARLGPADGLDEATAKAHYSLGVLASSAGHADEAIDHFSAAVKYQPDYVEAHIALADLDQRTGRVGQSLPHYDAALRINPRATEARWGDAIALTTLGRYAAARDALVEATKVQPEHPEFALALARLLAAAPDARVRDGQHALAIAQELFKDHKSTEVGETMAMALAELGDFQHAAAIQRGVLAAASKAHLPGDVRRMEANLRLYERHQPCRTPWKPDELFKPKEPSAASFADTAGQLEAGTGARGASPRPPD